MDPAGNQIPPNMTNASKDRPHRHAVRSPTAIAFFLIVAAAGLAGDLLSKHYVFESLLNDPIIAQRAESLSAFAEEPPTGEEMLHYLAITRRAMPGVRFTISTNPGVVFGLPAPPAAVAIITALAVILVAGFFATSCAKARSLHLALAFILAGALGNLYDRLFSEVAVPGAEPIRRQVRDFIDCRELFYPWIFNVADILLVAAAAILLMQWWVTRKPTPAKT